MAHGLILEATGERVQADGQGLGLQIGKQVGGRPHQFARQRPSIVVTLQHLPHRAHQGGLGAVRDEFDRVDEVLTLGAQTRELLVGRQVFQGQVPRGAAPLDFEFFEVGLPGGDGRMQLRFAGLPSFQFFRFGGV